MSEGGGLRARRVAEAVRARVSEMLLRDVADPKLSGVVITRVELSDDLGIAWVKARLLSGGEDPKARKRAMDHLAGVAARLRRGLAPALKLKRVPELRFAYDDGADATSRVETLLAEIAADAKK